MAGGNKGGSNVNSKAAAGRARKAETEAKKKSAEESQAEALAAKAWQDGADLRGASRAQTAAEKADEAARKRREKALLQAEEEANLGSGGKAKAPPKTAAPKKKKDDLSLLENALVKDAEKKLRAKKEKEEQMKRQEAEAEQRRREEEEARKKVTDPLLLATQSLLGEMGVSDDKNEGDMLVGRKANKAAFEENAASGIDAALDSVKGGGGNEVKSMKALYAAFEARMLPKMKDDYPGLRLTQYKDRIFQQWQKSPENPSNQHP